MDSRFTPEYEHVRTLWMGKLRWPMAVILCGVAVLVVRTFIEQWISPSTAKTLGGVLFTVGAIAFAYFTWKIYRCPQCDKLISNYKGVPLSADYCHTCGMLFRADMTIDDVRRKGR